MSSPPRHKIFDTHFHIIDSRFPLTPNQGYLPPEYDWKAYLDAAGRLGVVGGAVVSGSFQAFDQTYLIDALARLGPRYVGVTQLPPSVGDDELRRLDAAGVRAVRFNVRRGGSAEVGELANMAQRVYDLLGWHAELYIDSKDLAAIYATLIRLPRASIDHLGLSKAGLPTLLKLAERGVQVKATGFGRVDFDVAQAVRDITKANPASLVFGTDMPSTRAPRPFLDSDIDLVADALGDTLAKRVFYANAVAFYRPRETV
jgi:predicted TIM-barrel fold metal-dependent hydrolase